MKKLFYLFYLFLSTVCYSQQTKVITSYYTNKRPFEIFSITLPDSVKDGSYKRFHPNGNLFVSGTYKNGKRSEIWEYFETVEYPFRTLYKYDYSTEKMMEIYNDTLHPDCIGGFSELRFVVENLLKQDKPYLKTLIGKKKFNVVFFVANTGLLDSILFVPDTLNYLLKFPKIKVDDSESLQSYYSINKTAIEYLMNKLLYLQIWYMYKVPAKTGGIIVLPIEYE